MDHEECKAQTAALAPAPIWEVDTEMEYFQYPLAWENTTNEEKVIGKMGNQLKELFDKVIENRMRRAIALTLAIIVTFMYWGGNFV